MSPSAADIDKNPAPSNGALRHVGKDRANVNAPQPLKYSGTLDRYEYFDVTKIIGREFPTLQLSSILHSEEAIRDLAILVSQRGVVFFRNQDLTIEDQKVLGQQLGRLTGKPATSGLHRHALFNSKRGLKVDENGKLDDEVSIINSDQFRHLYGERYSPRSQLLASEGWHADITFERVPSDYAILKIVQVPEDAGGDTLWASGYEAYDRLSPAYKKLAESLTATHYQPNFNKIAKEHGEELLVEDRGAPENSGLDFKASHPVIRTNPVTGWKGLFAAGGQVEHGWIDGVTPRESDDLKKYFLDLISQNHDLQVRFKWNKNDLAIWDNRSVFHTATNDYYGKRSGNRVVSLGEVPFYDPNSKSRRESLDSRITD
ncbi:uncharacterized protein HMPREF1541_05212 [Cyphellophora europaea CBS 101466]|uniref:TauD/TfdA-like domain-containing protein n=1 Tax=Cyphellophora europaea (strain CBS 101466) TaxID=1220924 RepID=W2RWY8_CYPE1|nr:uncharacterized protein HMPREF1541_05212 [Cyphellophora europaea CBS 101466]ETN40932.1 hypothetical protein HMPREF1541_05212 [Cyphellophora europaea CBS 101466]